MFWTLREIVLGVHIFLGIIWAGGILFIGWGVFPAVRSMPYRNQREVLLRLMQWSHGLFGLSGAGVISTGIMFGTMFGPVRSIEVAASAPYGHHFLWALAVGVLTLGWGMFVSYPFAMSVLQKPVLWKLADEGCETFLKRALRSVTVISGVEGLGFLGLLAIMMTF